MAGDFSAEIRKLIADKKALIGTERTLKALRAGKLAKVYVAPNCAPKTLEAIRKYCEIGSVELEEIPMPAEELGVACKKPFSISVIGVLV